MRPDESQVPAPATTTQTTTHPTKASGRALRRRAGRTLRLAGAVAMTGLLAGSLLVQGAFAKPSGTSITATKTTTGHLVTTYPWTLSKSASKTSLTLSNGESGDVTFTVGATKGAGVLSAYFDGQICVTNTGGAATQGLAITDSVAKPPSKQVVGGPVTVDVTARPSLAPGETFCYSYRVDVFNGVTPGATYKDTATVTITNKSGPGSGPSPSATATLPMTSEAVNNDSITVVDSNGDSWTFSATGTQTYDKRFTCDADAGSRTNTVSAPGFVSTLTVPAPASVSAIVDVTCLDPDVTVTKTVDKATATVGDTLTYAVTVSNLGTGTAHGVTLTDALPALDNLAIGNTTDFDLSGTALTLSGQPIDLASSASLTVEVTGAVPETLCETTVTNTATVSATNEPAAQGGNNSASASTTVSCVNLEVTKTPDSPEVSAGDSIGYTITVTNNGGGPATSVSLTDTLPTDPGLSWSETSPDCDISGGVLTCDFGDLAPSGNASVHITSPTTAATCGTVTNTASASASNDGTAASNPADIDVLCPDITVTKVADSDSVSAGDQIGYEITVSNTGAGTASNVTLSDSLAYTGGLIWSLDGGTGVADCSLTSAVPQTNQVLSCSFGDLGSSESRSVRVVSPTFAFCYVVLNDATATATGIPPVTSDPASITINCPNVTVSKVPDAETIDGGNDAGYDITVTNGGAGTARGVTLTDTLPTNGGLYWAIDVAGSDAGCTISTGTLSCSFGDLAPGASKHVHITSPTTFDTCGTIDNTATAAATNEAAGDQADNSDSAPIAVNCAEIQVAKAADDASVDAGQDIGFLITVENVGTGTAQDVAVADTLPSATGLDWTIDNPGSDSGCTISAGDLSCSFGDLAAGASKHVHVTSPTTGDICAPSDASVSVDNTADASLSNGPGSASTASVDVLCPNDPPVNTVPGAQTVNEDTDLVFSGANSNLISIADPDAGTNPVEVTLGAGYGTLTLSGTTGLTFTTGDGTGDASMVFTGSITDINAALNGMKYRGNPDFNDSRGSESLSITTDDQGNTGTGGPLSASDTVDITVTAVNDAPTAAAKAFTVQANMKITGLSGLLTGATDPDTGDGGYTATFTVNDVVLDSCAGGTITNVNTSAGSFDFDPPAGSTGPCSLKYRVTDSGNPGPGATSAYATITITINGPVIWFVNSAAAGPGAGTLADPFKTLASADAVDASGHRIFLYSGTYANGISLNTSEWLIGQGVTGSGGTPFDTLFGITPPTGTIARPSINGARPIVQGNVVMATSDAVRGLNIQPASGTAGLTASSATGLTVGEVSVTTTNATAVSLTNSDGTFAFTSVSASGGPNGIVWNNASPATGSLTVNGDGSNTTLGGNASGGTISNMTGSDGTTAGIGVYLNNAHNVTLRRMTVNGTNQNFGIRGTSVTNFTMEYSTVSGVNGTSTPNREGSVIFDNLFGSGGIASSIVSGAIEDNLRVENTTGTLTAFNLTNSTIQNNSTVSGNIGFRFATATPGVTMTGTVSGSTFQGNRTIAIQADASNGTVTFTATNNTIIAGTGGNNQGNQGIEVDVANNGVMTFTVSGNKVGTDGITNQPLLNTGINIFNGTLVTSGTPAVITGTVTNNTVYNAGAGQSGFGIRLFNQGHGTMNANVSGNTVNNVGLDYGIFAEVSSNSGTANATGSSSIGMTNNTSNVLSGALDAIRLQARGRSTMCARVSGNASTTAGTGFFGLEIRQAAQTISAVTYQALFNLEGLTSGLQTDHTTILNYLASQNPAVTDGVDEIHSNGITGVATNSCSSIP